MRQLPLQFAFIWHSYLLVGICGMLSSLWLAPAACAVIALAILDKRLWRWQRLALAAAIFASAFACGSWQFGYARRGIAHPPGWLAEKSQRICGQITSSQGLADNRLRVLLAKVGPPGCAPLPGLCAWTWEKPVFEPLPGQMICISKQPKAVGGFANYAEDSYEAGLFAQDILWRFWSDGDAGKPELTGSPRIGAQLRENLRRAFLAVLWPDTQAGGYARMPQARAIILSLLFGDRRFLSRSTMNDFASATLAHSLALSGQHLGIVLLAGSLLALAASRFRPQAYLAFPRPMLVLMIALPFALLYLWLGNSPSSLKRAAGMLIFATVWLWRGRPFSGLDLLCATLLLILLVDPFAVFDVGLQMSALCVGVILLTWPGVSRLMPCKERQGWRSYLLNGAFQIFAVSILIQIALLPLALARFQLAGFWFPLNMLWLPALGFIVLPCAALALILLPFGNISSLAIDLATWPCQLLLNLLHSLRQHGLLAEPAFMLPHWTAMLAYLFIAVILAWLWGNPGKTRQFAAKGRALLCVALLLLAVAPSLRLMELSDEKPVIEALDTGQSQAILVSLPGGIRFLVDGGGSYYNKFDPGKMIVAPALCWNRAPRLAAVFNSHPDLDHLGGLFHILDHFEVGQVFHNGRSAKTGSEDIWHRLQDSYQAKVLQAGDRVLIGENAFQISALHPPDSSLKWNGNGASLILRLSHGDNGLAIFPGDAEKANLAEVLARNKNLNAQILFAPHHGSDKNVLEAFYRAVVPRVVIACCGMHNRWNYPGKKLKAMLAASNISLFSTGIHGRVKIAFNGRDAIESIGTIRNPGRPPD